MTVLRTGRGNGMVRSWVGDWVYMIPELGRRFLRAPFVDTGHWQAMKDVPQTKTIELSPVVLELLIPDTIGELTFLEPSDPWAEHQFQERVGGLPLNPGETYVEWPWYRGNVEAHKGQGQFSHTYMERYWPRFTGRYSEENGYGGVFLAGNGPRGQKGIRYRYGDLADVVSLLAREPFTRQAYLPVWFPEDTGAHHGERVPCSLGYHFMLRDGRLNCWYDIRSCDFLRHFRDDVYLTCRLVQWVVDQLQNKHNTASQDEGFDWDGVRPGHLTMSMHSLHVFEGDMPKMRREYGDGEASVQA